MSARGEAIDSAAAPRPGRKLGLRAALTTLREIRRRQVPVYLQRLGAELQTRLNEVARDTGLPVSCERSIWPSSHAG